MAAFAEVVDDLLARPRPVICLDTCDLLDVIRDCVRGKARRLEHARRFRDKLSSPQGVAQLVVSYLVPIEWSQNKDTVVEEVAKKLRAMDASISEVHLAWRHEGHSLGEATPAYATNNLPERLAALANDLLTAAVRLDQDADCVGRALDRVHRKRRPSHEGKVKDSIHLEHYLELCRRLEAKEYKEPRVFVSANKADFGDEAGRSVHPELEDDFLNAGLKYFTSLEAALGQLNI